LYSLAPADLRAALRFAEARKSWLVGRLSEYAAMGDDSELAKATVRIYRDQIEAAERERAEVEQQILSE
jgi:hypothetical protein